MNTEPKPDEVWLADLGMTAKSFTRQYCDLRKRSDSVDFLHDSKN